MNRGTFRLAAGGVAIAALVVVSAASAGPFGVQQLSPVAGCIQEAPTSDAACTAGKGPSAESQWEARERKTHAREP